MYRDFGHFAGSIRDGEGVVVMLRGVVETRSSSRTCLPKSSSLVCSIDGRSCLWLTPQVPHCEERPGAAHSRWD